MRENTLGRVAHPDTIRLPDGERHLIEDPHADRLFKGDPVLGWEGDDRLALYVNYRAGRWELIRLEGDGNYRFVVAVPGFVRGHEAIGWLIVWLVEHDVRRGFDPRAATDAVNDGIEKAARKAETERNHEFAERLEHGLLKDVGATEVGLTKRLH